MKQSYEVEGSNDFDVIIPQVNLLHIHPIKLSLHAIVIMDASIKQRPYINGLSFNDMMSQNSALVIQELEVANRK